MSEIKIYDKFLSPIEYTIIRDEIMSEQWSWEFSDKITTVHDEGEDFGQFVKVLYMHNYGRMNRFGLLANHRQKCMMLVVVMKFHYFV